MRAFGVLTLLIVTATCLWSQQRSNGLGDRVAIVESGVKVDQVDHIQITRLFWRLILEEKLELRTPPRILVIHLSQPAATHFGPFAETVRVDHCETSVGDVYYQLWIVGKPSAQAYVDGLQRVLEREFGLRSSEPERNALLERVIMQEAKTPALNTEPTGGN